MSADVAFRPAVISEKAQLESLQWRASLNNPGDRSALLGHADAIEIPVEQLADGHVFVAESAGAIVGFAAVLARGDGGAELDALFVEPTLWRRGYGRALVHHCIEVARRRGSAALHVVGNPHAEAFYNACGFDVVGSQETRFGVGILMRKTL